jgi:hypothetical protein
MKHILLFLVLFIFLSCVKERMNLSDSSVYIAEAVQDTLETLPGVILEPDGDSKTIYFLVALCDNTYQGIVPVPKRIGNGQNPDENLYWGCGYGIKTYFKKSQQWNLIHTEKMDSLILERLVFKHVNQPVYLVADAYNGKHIKTCTEDFLDALCGSKKNLLTLKDKTIGIHGYASLVSYIGHNGLMDFSLDRNFPVQDTLNRKSIILACYSKRYFNSYLNSMSVEPLVWTIGLMAPEAYTLHDALESYLNQGTAEEIRSQAAKAYARYQKCSDKAARNLLVSGF